MIRRLQFGGVREKSNNDSYNTTLTKLSYLIYFTSVSWQILIQTEYNLINNELFWFIKYCKAQTVTLPDPIYNRYPKPK